MNRLNKAFYSFLVLCLGSFATTASFAETPSHETASAVEAVQPRTEVIMSDHLAGDDTKVKTVFTSQTPEIYIQLQSNAVKVNQKLKFIWIADDTNNAAPNNTKIDEVEVAVSEELAPGKVFTAQSSLNKPTTEQGWPAGKYHVDIYLDSTLLKTEPFTIEAHAQAE